MNYFKTFISSILAGMSIGFGGVVFLSVDDRVLGALLFTVGLFSVCTFGFHLFTGKFCYVFFNDRKYALSLPLIWVGNLLGTGIIAGLVHAARIAPISEKAAAMCEIKVNDSLLSLFVLGILCNILIYFAVEGYAKNPHQLGKYLSIFFGVMVFILCGTEHCVADMFYFWVSGSWSPRAVLCIIVITLGNCVGGVIVPLLRKAAAQKTAA